MANMTETKKIWVAPELKKADLAHITAAHTGRVSDKKGVS